MGFQFKNIYYKPPTHTKTQENEIKGKQKICYKNYDALSNAITGIIALLCFVLTYEGEIFRDDVRKTILESFQAQLHISKNMTHDFDVPVSIHLRE